MCVSWLVGLHVSVFTLFSEGKEGFWVRFFWVLWNSGRNACVVRILAVSIPKKTLILETVIKLTQI